MVFRQMSGSMLAKLNRKVDPTSPVDFVSDGLKSESAFILRRRLLEELIEQFLLLELGQVARKILLDTLADSQRKFFKNLLVDLLQCSQPADVTTAALDEPLDVVGNLADEPPFELELKVVIVGQWRAPILLRGRTMPACLVGDLIEQAIVRLFQRDFLQLFKPRSVVRSKVELVGFHQTEISDDKQFAFHDLERSRPSSQTTMETGRTRSA